MAKVYIIGVGGDGPASLGQKALDIIKGADLLCGGERLLDFFPDAPGKKVPVRSNLKEVAALIEDRLGSERIAVLASGDPSFYGIARYLVGALGKENLEIIPNVTSMQLAFASIKESWDDAVLASVHGRSIEEIVGLVRSGRKIGVLTDNQHTPREIGRILVSHGLSGYRAFVCEDLGDVNERVTETDLAGLADLPSSPLNVLILLKEGGDDPGETTGPRERSFGIPDDEFFRRKPAKGLITKAEVRAVSLSKLGLRQDSMVWDVGAGSGSVTIEASLIATRGHVYAVERRPEDAAIVKRNLEKFGVSNAAVIEGIAPEALAALPDPDAVFIGGTGGRMDGILDAAGRRLRAGGHIVVNIATMANLASAVRGLAVRGFEVDITLVNIARSKDVAGLMRLEALDPVFVVSAGRKGER